jgi:hypothetical protein
MTYEDLTKFGLRKKKYDSTDLYLLSNINGFPVPWSSNSYFPESQYFYVIDGSNTRYYLVQATGTTGTTAPSAAQASITATYTSSNGSYSFRFIGYDIPGKF